MPVYSSHFVDAEKLGVCRRLRDERLRANLTLREMAERVGLSAAQLSNLENGKANVDVGRLVEISRVLNVPVKTFFPQSQQYHYLLRRRESMSSQPPIRRDLIGVAPGVTKHHNFVSPFAELFVGRHMEPMLGQVQPLADKDIHFIAHDHEEFMFVLEGQVESLIKTNNGIASERLEAGDCLYFWSYLPHCHRSCSSQPARTLHVTHSLRGAIDYGGELGPSGHQFYRPSLHDDLTKEISEKIALLRRSRGFTLSELGRAVGMSARHLALVEQGGTAPDLNLLLRLARQFGRPIEYFLETAFEEQPHYFVQRGRDIHQIPVRQRRPSSNEQSTTVANTYRCLANGFPHRGLHPYYIQVTSSTGEGPTPYSHHGQEFVYVLEGEAEFVTYVGNEEVRELLQAGDALYLESSVPHRIIGRSRNPYAAKSAEIIDVFWSPLGEDHLFLDASSTAPVLG